MKCVVEIWEHAWRNKIEQNAEVKEFVRGLGLEAPLNPRDAFFGGRVNATTLYYAASPDEKIKYYDFR